MEEFAFKSDWEISECIACPKEIRGRISKPADKNRNKEQRFLVYSIEDASQFHVFITQSMRMPNEFSVGLVFENYLLYRCNGFHGTTRSGFYTAEHHAYAHSHTLTIEDICNGRQQKPSKTTSTEGKYVDLDTAILYFCKQCGILNYVKYFPIAGGIQTKFEV